MVYARKNCLACPATRPGKFHPYPLFFSVLRIRTDFAPCPRVEMYRLTSTLCQPLSLSYFGCPCVPSGIRYWQSFDHCFAQLQWTWRQLSILEFFFLRVENYFSYFGLDSSCLLSKVTSKQMIRVILREWWKDAIDVRVSWCQNFQHTKQWTFCSNLVCKTKIAVFSFIAIIKSILMCTKRVSRLFAQASTYVIEAI